MNSYILLEMSKAAELARYLTGCFRAIVIILAFPVAILFVFELARFIRVAFTAVHLAYLLVKREIVRRRIEKEFGYGAYEKLLEELEAKLE